MVRTKNLQTNWYYLVIMGALVLLAAFFSVRDSLAGIAWEKHGRADWAFRLVWSDATLAMQLGNYYFNGGAYDLGKAEQAYKKAVAKDPVIFWGHYQLARIYFVRGEYDKAIREVEKELEGNPENLRALYVRGLIYAYQDSFDKAEEDLRQFVEWAPKEWAGYNDLALVLSRLGKYQEAKKVISIAMREAPKASDNPWLLNGRGVAELNLGEYALADKSFRGALYVLGKLDLAEWRKAYPGNDPAQAESGLNSFRKAIEENMRRASEGK